MQKRFCLHEKGSEVGIEARATPASPLFKGLVTEHRTVKWSIDRNVCRVPLLIRVEKMPPLHTWATTIPLQANQEHGHVAPGRFANHFDRVLDSSRLPYLVLIKITKKSIMKYLQPRRSFGSSSNLLPTRIV